MKAARIREDSYFDSVFLMSVGSGLKKRDGLRDAVVAMGTAMNLELLRDQGYPPSILEAATPNDLVVAVDAIDDAAIDAAFAALDELIASGSRSKVEGGNRQAATLDAALDLLPGANLAIISLPGHYAAREARRALGRGLHVMLFSDNVAIEDEISLKALGREKGLLVMGPDCGTAIISGMPLCFANVVRRGSVGIVAASGTGLQEVTCLLDRLGSGVSQAIGTGGRDLKDERVGGSTMLSGIEALAADPETKVIAIVSKPPAEAVAQRILKALSSAGKPAVVHFVGRRDPGPARDAGPVRMAASLEATATLAAGLSGTPGASLRIFEGPDVSALAAREASKLAQGQVFLRGYYTGGTVADEALFLLHGAIGGVWSNNQTDPAWQLADPLVSVGHTIVDLGDDVFTLGRPHPMIEPSTRNDRILAEIDDGEIAVVILDVVLGYGSHHDPAGALVPAIAAARSAAAKRGGYLPVIASVIGTDGDFQGYRGQVAKLEAAGCVVMPSNYRATLLASRIAELAWSGRGVAR